MCATTAHRGAWVVYLLGDGIWMVWGTGGLAGARSPSRFENWHCINWSFSTILKKKTGTFHLPLTIQFQSLGLRRFLLVWRALCPRDSWWGPGCWLSTMMSPTSLLSPRCLSASSATVRMLASFFFSFDLWFLEWHLPDCYLFIYLYEILRIHFNLVVLVETPSDWLVRWLVK